jgi:hypothetical protein
MASRLLIARAAAVALLALPLVFACGKKGPPRPPPKLIPAPITDLRVRQTGDRLVLLMTYPAVTTSGLALERVEALDVVAFRPKAAGQAPLDPRILETVAPVAKRLEGPELVAAVRGPALRVEHDAASGAARGPSTEADPAAIQIAVRSFGPRGHPSPLSNVVSIAPRTAPAPPDSVEVVAEAGGIRVRWTSSTAEATGFGVYRRLAGEQEYWPIAELGPDAREHLDGTAALGTDYEYTVRTRAASEPAIESVDGAVRALQYRDTFPPPTPSGLVALAEEGRIRLLWDRVDAPDLAGYRLYRQENDGAEVELPRDPGAGADHSDDQVRSGATYTYRVTAVDGEDNESAKSEPATAMPR